LNDLIRSCTELECIVEDLTASGEHSSGRREELETELSNLNAEIAHAEAELAQLIPEWEQRKEAELNEKRSLDLAKGQLGALYSKQGRLSKFRTQGERDEYLRSEIASVEAYRQTQLAALQTTQQDLTSSRVSLQDIETMIANAETQANDGRERVKELSVQIAALKTQSTELTERRKELWREETKLASQIGQASEEFRSAERNLASMMDKV
jgi:structural maintenance of chromosome 3 (chondroitin sulfate proteoglycan 6)